MMHQLSSAEQIHLKFQRQAVGQSVNVNFREITTKQIWELNHKWNLPGLKNASLIEVGQHNHWNRFLTDQPPQSPSLGLAIAEERCNVEHFSLFVSINRTHLDRFISSLCKKCLTVMLTNFKALRRGRGERENKFL